MPGHPLPWRPARRPRGDRAPPVHTLTRRPRTAPAGARPEDVATAFTSLLDNHVSVVNDFYMERIEEGVIILHALHQHIEEIRAGAVRPEFRTACQKSLVQLHFQLLVLQNYVALNFTALTKILKKFEKKFEVPVRNDYIGAIVELPFYRCDALGDLVEETERQFRELDALGQQLAPHAQQQQQQQEPGQMPPPQQQSQAPSQQMPPPQPPPPSQQHARSAAAPSSQMPPPPPPMGGSTFSVSTMAPPPPPPKQAGMAAHVMTECHSPHSGQGAAVRVG